MTFKHFFAPNQKLSSKTMGILALSQAIFAIAVWWVSPQQLLPTPLEVFSAFGTLFTKDGLIVELWSSFSLNLEVIVLTLVCSLALSYLTVLPFFRPLAWFFSKGRFVSTVGLTFVFTMFTTGAHQLKLSLMVFLMSVFFVTSMYEVIASTLQDDLDYGRVLYKKEWGVVWETIILGKVDSVFEILRQVAAIGWAVLTMVEGLARSGGGVGVLLLNNSKYFHLDKVFAIQICILLIGICQDYVIGWFRDTLCPYAAMEKGKR